MKKLRLFLFAAVIAIAASAFNVTSSEDEYVLVGQNFVLKATAEGNCQNGGTVCTYTLLPIEERVHEMPPYSEQDFSFNTSEGKIWIPD